MVKSSLIVLLVVLLFGCNPYPGFKGVNRKGMSKNSVPSQELKEDYKKKNKRMQKRFDREMKRRKKKMGSQE
jgi:hypothetical protein